MDEVVDNIGTVTDKLAIVIATHAHQDHISGFDGAKFGKFEIGEVWMPWTEDPDGPQSKRSEPEKETRRPRGATGPSFCRASFHLTSNFKIPSCCQCCRGKPGDQQECTSGPAFRFWR